jgi:hypothetical protein
MVGFSTMATVHAADGTLLLDQEMPVTAAGLSGMTMIHHQPHATTPRARTCVECHRAPAALGYGTVNHRLAREMLFAAGEQGVEILGFDRKNAGNTKSLGNVPLPGIKAFGIRCDDLQGRAAWGFAATVEGDLWTLDLRSPLGPKATGRLEKAVEDPRALLVADGTLYVADGKRGVASFDVTQPARPKARWVHALEAPGEARGLHLDGPWLHVAAGNAGLVILDVSDPATPAVVGKVRPGDPELPLDARAVSVLFQFSRPNPADPRGPRLPPRGLAAVADGFRGAWLVDVTRPEAPRTLGLVPGPGGTDVALGTVFALGSEGGGIPSRETDLLFLATPNALLVADVSDPYGVPSPREVASVAIPGGGARTLRTVRVYNPPFLQSFVAVGAAGGVVLVEVTRPSDPAVRGTAAAPPTGFLGVEEFPLDRMIDSRGKPLKDVSHEGARYLDPGELLRVLRAPLR